MKLTWNQERALSILQGYDIEGVKLSLVREISWGFRPYLCGSAGKAAVSALCVKKLAECCFEGKPRRYRITDAGRAALAEKEGMR